MFEEIRRRVAEGRWEIVGGWWVEPDCNIPHGESFCRQGLYGQRYFKEKFGAHRPGRLQPRQLRPCRLAAADPEEERARLLRLHAAQPAGKGPARAGCSGGSRTTARRVLTYRIPYEYGTKPEEIDKHVRRVGCRAAAAAQGDHGLLRRRQPRRRADAAKHRIHSPAGRGARTFPRLVFSRTDDYFAAVEAERLPCPSSTTTCSTTRAAPMRRTPGSRRGTAGRSGC